MASSPEASVADAATPSPAKPAVDTTSSRRLLSKGPALERVAEAAEEEAPEVLDAEKADSDKKKEAAADDEDIKSQTLSQQMAKLYGLHRLRTQEAITSASFAEILKDGAAKKPFKLEVDKCKSLQTMNDSCDEVLGIEERSAYHAFQDDFEDAVLVAKELMDSVVVAASDVSSQWKAKGRAEVRKKKAEEQTAQKLLLKQVREEAAQKAKEIREKNAEPATGLAAMFTCDIAKIQGVAEVPKYTSVPRAGTDPASASVLWDRPFILSNDEDVALFLGDDKVQGALSTYGSKYKKDLPRAKLKESMGRTQTKLREVEDAGALEAVQTLFKQFSACECDISEVQGGEIFMKSAYLFGCLPHPDMSFVGFQANSAACIKVMSMGKVRTVLIKTSTLVETTRTRVGPAAENLDYIDSMRTFPEKHLQDLCVGGVKMWQCIHCPGDLLYIPQGYVCVESSVSAKPSDLVFGFRKSFMGKRESAIADYASCIELFQGAGRDVGRMRSIIDAMKASTT